MVKIAALNFLAKIFPILNKSTERNEENVSVSTESARKQLAGLEQCRQTPIDIDAGLAINDHGQASQKDPPITIVKDPKDWPQVEGYLKKIGVPEDRIQNGSFKLLDIPDPKQRQLTKALLYLSVDRSSKYTDGNKNGLKKEKLQLDASVAKLGGFMLEKYPQQTEALFGAQAVGCGDKAMNAAVLENFLGNHLREHQVMSVTPRLTEFNHLASCSMKDYTDAGFSGADLKGIHFPKTDIAAYEQAARSVVKFESTPTSSSSQNIYQGSAVLVADPKAPGKVVVMTARHCIDGDAFKNGTAIQANNYDMTINVAGKTHKIDPASMKAADANGDYVTFALKSENKPFDLSQNATTLAKQAPKYTDEIIAIGYPQLSNRKLSFAAGSFARYLETDASSTASKPLAAESNMIVNHGYSGGGIFNKNGELLGITIQRSNQWENSNFYPLILPPVVEIKAPQAGGAPSADEVPSK